MSRDVLAVNVFAVNLAELKRYAFTVEQLGARFIVLRAGARVDAAEHVFKIDVWRSAQDHLDADKRSTRE